MEDILGKLAEHSFAAALLFIAVRYLVKKNEKLEAEIARLNEASKADQKEHITKTIGALNDNTTVMDKLTDIIKYGKD